MKIKNNNKRDNPWLRWIVGLEFAAVIIVGIILAVFVFRSGVFGGASDLTASPTITSIANEFPTPTPILVQASTNPTTLEPAHNFDFSTANQVLPDDIIQEVAFFGGQGGGGDFCSSDEVMLRLLQIPDQKIELMNSISVEVCGVTPEETLTIRILYTNGTEKTLDERIEPDQHSFSFSYPTSVDDPVGTYTIVISGKNGEVEFQQTVVAPRGPRLYHVDNNWIFLNFRPKERIRVVAYRTEINCFEEAHEKCIFSPIFWQEYSADESGKLIVTSEEKNIVGIGELAGKVTSSDGYWHSAPVFMGGEYCPNALPSLNLQPGAWVMVTDDLAWVDSIEWLNSSDPVANTNEYVAWDSNAKIYVPKGTVFRVGSYVTTGDCEGIGMPPACSLQIYCDIGTEYCDQNKPTTVIPEGFKDKYFIRSISQPDDNTPLECGDLPKPSLQIGNYAVVTDAEGLGLKTTPYETDYLNSTITKLLLPQGTRIKIVAGPICNQELSYFYYYEWFAQTDTGFDGWVTEGRVHAGRTLELALKHCMKVRAAFVNFS